MREKDEQRGREVGEGAKGREWRRGGEATGEAGEGSGEKEMERGLAQRVKNSY